MFLMAPIDTTAGLLWWRWFGMFTYQLKQLHFVLILFTVQLMYWKPPCLCTWRMQVCPCPLMKKCWSAVSIPPKKKLLCSGRELWVTPTTSVSSALSMRRGWAIRRVTRLSSHCQSFVKERKVSEIVSVFGQVCTFPFVYLIHFIIWKLEMFKPQILRIEIVRILFMYIVGTPCLRREASSTWFRIKAWGIE